MIAFLEKLRMYGVKTSVSYAISEFKNRTITRYLKSSYSQNGEDLVIDEEAEWCKKQGYRLVEAPEVELHRLDDILSEYCGTREIDFMSVDTEGLDLDVLQSNDWNRFKPRVVCVESVRHGINWNTVEAGTDCERLLASFGYEKVHDSGLNSIYLLSQEDCPNR